MGESTRFFATGEQLQFMKNRLIFIVPLLLLLACSPRDFLTRRLASDLLSASTPFHAPQRFTLQIGVVSGKDYPSPDYVVLQHHGWISANSAPCAPGLVPPPCWDILLTPAGVDTIRPLLPAEEAGHSSLTFPIAKRQLVEVTGISKDGNFADVEFRWKWAPLNELGAALYSGDLQYSSTVGFRHYDDGWRVVQSAPHPSQTLDDALKNAEPVP